MDPLNHKKSFSFIVLIIFVLFIVVFSMKVGVKDADKEVEEIKIGDLQEKIDIRELPGDLPKDLPVEADAFIIRNEIVHYNKSNEVHSTRVYVSEKSTEENFLLFEKYLNNNGWKILAKLDQPDLKYLVAQNNKMEGVLQFNISLNSITGQVIVETSFIKKTAPESSINSTP